MVKVSVKVGDTVLVNSGKDSGKQGKVLAINKTKKGVKVLVEGVNIVTKAKKARTAQEKSELVKMEAAIDVSNVNVVCPTCGKPTRVKHTLVDGKKVRVCACGAVLDGKYSKEAKKVKAESDKKAEEVKAEKPAKSQKSKSSAVKAEKNEKATKVATAKKPTTSRSSQRGV